MVVVKEHFARIDLFFFAFFFSVYLQSEDHGVTVPGLGWRRIRGESVYMSENMNENEEKKKSQESKVLLK